MKKVLLILLLILTIQKSQAQLWDWGLGVAGIFNLQPMGIGIDGRALIMLDDDVVGFAPQINYYPGIFELKEWYAGGHLQYNFRPYKKIGIYALFGGYYNKFEIGHERRPFDKDWAFTMQPGLGIMRNNGCIRPFAEARYDTKWKEYSGRVGLLFMWGSCFPEPTCAPADNPYSL